MLYSELEKKIDSLSYEYKMTICNMIDFFIEKQNAEKKTSLEEGKKAFFSMREDVSTFPELTLDEINEEIAAARKVKKAVLI